MNWHLVCRYERTVVQIFYLDEIWNGHFPFRYLQESWNEFRLNSHRLFFESILGQMFEWHISYYHIRKLGSLMERAKHRASQLPSSNAFSTLSHTNPHSFSTQHSAPMIRRSSNALHFARNINAECEEWWSKAKTHIIYQYLYNDTNQANQKKETRALFQRTENINSAWKSKWKIFRAISSYTHTDWASIWRSLRFFHLPIVFSAASYSFRCVRSLFYVAIYLTWFAHKKPNQSIQWVHRTRDI